MQKRSAADPPLFPAAGVSDARDVRDGGITTDYFALVDRKNKIYSRRQVAETAALDVGLRVNPGADATGSLHDGAPEQRNAGQPGRAGRSSSSWAARGLVNDGLTSSTSRAGRAEYLEPMRASQLRHLAPRAPDLHVELRRVLQEARSRNRRASADCRIAEEGTVRPITIEGHSGGGPGDQGALLHGAVPRREKCPVRARGEGDAASSLTPAATEGERRARTQARHDQGVLAERDRGAGRLE